MIPGCVLWQFALLEISYLKIPLLRLMFNVGFWTP